MSTMTTTVTPEQKEQYHEEGYMILERAISADLLEVAREACDAACHRMEEDLRSRGLEEEGINRINSRYFIGHPRKQSPSLYKVIFNDVFADIARATLGDEAYLFWEQFVVKYRDKKSVFAWHQDDGYTEGTPHDPTTTCWVALDDVGEENGTLSILPYSRGGGKKLLEHVWDEELNNQVGYKGDDPGIPLKMPAGSIAVFSSLTLHRSGPNQTDRPRRGYFLSFSNDLMYHSDPAQGMWGSGEPFLRGGERVDALAKGYWSL